MAACLGKCGGARYATGRLARLLPVRGRFVVVVNYHYFEVLLLLLRVGAFHGFLSRCTFSADFKSWRFQCPAAPTARLLLVICSRGNGKLSPQSYQKCNATQKVKRKEKKKTVKSCKTVGQGCFIVLNGGSQPEMPSVPVWAARVCV